MQLKVFLRINWSNSLHCLRTPVPSLSRVSIKTTCFPLFLPFLLTLNPLSPPQNTFNHCSCNLKPVIKFTKLPIYCHPPYNQLERFFVFPKCCFGTYIIDIPPSGSQWCSNLGIYINDLVRVKRQWLLCILWSATECKLMTLDDITTQIERHYELTTNTTHSLRGWHNISLHIPGSEDS